MKKLKLLLILTTILSFNYINSQDLTCESNEHFELKPSENRKLKSNNEILNLQNTVYICTANYAYTFHSNSECVGLNNCKGQIKSIDSYTAKNQLKRVPCCRCWNNVNGCKDDNSTEGGDAKGESDGDADRYNDGYNDGYKDGVDSDPSIYYAIVVIGSAVVLSNDIYLYPSYSFKKFDNYEINGEGLVFGLRKKLKNSALEYGMSVFKYKQPNFINNNENHYNKNVLGIHFNYVHDIFINKKPDKIKYYIGSTVNHVDNWGIGVIIGSKIKLHNRLDLDFRYELSTQTNQLQLGLIFTYQKEYFWKKDK